MSRLLSKLCTMKAERDEVVDNVIATKEEAFQFLTKLVALRSKAEVLRARGTDLNVNEKTSCAELEAMMGE
ncbi:hypothetical protein ACLOJK_022766, partial [Asimina triloba]